jgi:hypothetical protein
MSDLESTGSNPHISFVVSRWRILSLENLVLTGTFVCWQESTASADRQIIREASCLEVTRELERDFPSRLLAN